MGQAKTSQPMPGSCSALYLSPAAQVCWDPHFCFSSDLLEQVNGESFSYSWTSRNAISQATLQWEERRWTWGCYYDSHIYEVFSLLFWLLFLYRGGHDVHFQLIWNWYASDIANPSSLHSPFSEQKLLLFLIFFDAVYGVMFYWCGHVS